MKYFDTHIFVIIHFAPLFSVYIRVTQLYVTIFQRVRRHKVTIVNLLKIIGDS